jgi:hypothetical protein
MIAPYTTAGGIYLPATAARAPSEGCGPVIEVLESTTSVTLPGEVFLVLGVSGGVLLAVFLFVLFLLIRRTRSTPGRRF